jgi:hypothetical protein
MRFIVLTVVSIQIMGFNFRLDGLKELATVAYPGILFGGEGWWLNKFI